MGAITYNEYKPTRHPEQLREVMGDNIESICTHESCDKCNGSGIINGVRCPKSVECNCPKCLGSGH